MFPVFYQNVTDELISQSGFSLDEEPDEGFASSFNRQQGREQEHGRAEKVFKRGSVFAKTLVMR